MKELYIIGTGSQARYIIENSKNSEKYMIKGLIDIENEGNISKTINGIKVICFLPDIEKYIDPKKSEVIVAYGDNKKKKEIVSDLSKKAYNFATIISDKNHISSFVEIGKGSIINPNVTIMPNVKIGNHVIIHSGSVIEHDNEVEDFVNIAPGVNTSGNVKVGEGTYLYAGAIIVPKIKIGKWVIVGAGSVVLKDVPDKLVVAGIPAKLIKKGDN